MGSACRLRETQQRKLVLGVAGCRREIEHQETVVSTESTRRMRQATSLAEEAQERLVKLQSQVRQEALRRKMRHGLKAPLLQQLGQQKSEAGKDKCGVDATRMATQLWERCEELTHSEVEQQEEVEKLQARQILTARELEADRMLTAEMRIGQELRVEEEVAEFSRWRREVERLSEEHEELLAAPMASCGK